MADILDIRSRLGIEDGSEIHLRAADLLAVGDDTAGAWLLGDDRSAIVALCADLGHLLDARRHRHSTSLEPRIHHLTTRLATRLHRDETYGLVVSGEELSCLELRLGNATVAAVCAHHGIRTSPRIAETALA